VDPVTLIVTALAAGAALGVTDTASSAVKDAYAGLKALVRKRLAGRPDAEVVLARHEQSPDTWRAPLLEELGQAGAASDPGLLAAAQALLRLIDEAGTKAGKYTVDARGAQGVVTGDGNVQINRFSVPPADLRRAAGIVTEPFGDGAEGAR
jgi:hypothetical protein